MDLLFKRYASPFLFIDGMLDAVRFTDFVDDFIKTINREIKAENKEKDMQANWELWLHRIWDKTFPEYMKEIEINEEHQNLSESIIETTLQHTSDILNNFNPEKRGE